MTEQAQEVMVDEYARALRLPGLRQVFRDRARQAVDQGQHPVAYLAGCLNQEILHRQESMLKRRLQEARFPVIKTLDGFDFAAMPSLPKERVLSLAEGRFVRQKENVLLIGQSGTGKSHLATGLGMAVIQHGYRVRFVTVSVLIQELLAAQDEHRLPRYLQSWRKIDLVVLDELGYVGLGPGSPLIFQFCAERYERGSMIITSNLEFSRWTEVFGDPTMTTALLDRLTHHAQVLVFNGESYRFRQSQTRNSGRAQ